MPSRDSLLHVYFELDKNCVPADALDVAPGNAKPVFRRKRGEDSVSARQNYRAYLTGEAVQLDIGYAAEQASVADVYYLFRAELGKACDCRR